MKISSSAFSRILFWELLGKIGVCILMIEVSLNVKADLESMLG